MYKNNSFPAILSGLILVFILTSCSSSRNAAVPCPKFSGKRYQQSRHEEGTRRDRQANPHKSWRPAIPGEYITHKSSRQTSHENPAYLEELSASLENTGTPGLVRNLDRYEAIPEREDNSNLGLLFSRLSCDTIVLLTGELIPAKVLEISPETIRYRKCDNPEGPVFLCKSAEVFMIKYPNGTRDYFSAVDRDAPAKQAAQVDTDRPKTEGMGLAGFISSLVGFFVMGIPLGILSVVFGAISLGKMKRNPRKYKGRGFAIASVIIGLVDIIGAIYVISIMQ